MTSMTLIQMALALFVLYSCFCRLVYTNAETLPTLRWAIWFKGTAAAMVLGAPILPWLHPLRATWAYGTTPTWVWVILLVSIVADQAAQARFWHHGAPHLVQRVPHS